MLIYLTFISFLEIQARFEFYSVDKFYLKLKFYLNITPRRTDLVQCISLDIYVKLTGFSDRFCNPKTNLFAKSDRFHV